MRINELKSLLEGEIACSAGPYCTFLFAVFPEERLHSLFQSKSLTNAWSCKLYGAMMQWSEERECSSMNIISFYMHNGIGLMYTTQWSFPIHTAVPWIIGPQTVFTCSLEIDLSHHAQLSNGRRTVVRGCEALQVHVRSWQFNLVLEFRPTFWSRLWHINNSIAMCVSWSWPEGLSHKHGTFMLHGLAISDFVFLSFVCMWHPRTTWATPSEMYLWGRIKELAEIHWVYGDTVKSAEAVKYKQKQIQNTVLSMGMMRFWQLLCCCWEGGRK